eukprot:scaffold315022_cov35-Tisochrysis_lutea.AAC.1
MMYGLDERSLIQLAAQQATWFWVAPASGLTTAPSGSGPPVTLHVERRLQALTAGVRGGFVARSMRCGRGAGRRRPKRSPPLTKREWCRVLGVCTRAWLLGHLLQDGEGGRV